MNNERVQAAIDEAVVQVALVVQASGGIVLTEGAARKSVEQAINNVALVAAEQGRACDCRKAHHIYFCTVGCRRTWLVHDGTNECPNGCEAELEATS